MGEILVSFFGRRVDFVVFSLFFQLIFIFLFIRNRNRNRNRELIPPLFPIVRTKK